MGQFPEDVVRQAWTRAGGRCECQGASHLYGRCNRELVWENRGRETGTGAWEAHHIVSQETGGAPILSNCEILCWDCYRRVEAKQTA